MHHIQPKSRQYYMFVALLGMLTSFGPLSIDMYLPALPAIAGDLQADISRIQLSLSSFFIGLSLGQVFYGPVADRYGRKKPLYAGMLIYILASIGCAMATNDHSLIVFRFLQALGSCAGGVVARAMVRDLFDNKEAAQVYSLQMLISGVAPILAPLLGSYVLSISGWRMIFWLLAIFSTLCLAVMLAFLPETHAGDKDVKFRRAFHTYLDIAKGREFLGYTLVGSLGSAGLFAYITGSSFVFIELFGMTPGGYSWLFGANAFGLIGMSQFNAFLLRRGHEPEHILNKALQVMTGASLLLLVATLLAPSLYTILPPLFVFMSMMGIVFPNMAAGALQHEKKRAGAASALMGMLQFVISTVASGAVAMLHAKTALPMTGIMAFCGCVAYGVYMAFGFAREKIKPKFAAEPPHITE